MILKSSKKYEAFAREYVIDYNGKRAAIAAGYRPSRAEVTGSELVRNRKVQRLIDQLETERAVRCQVDGDRVLEEVQRLAYSNMADFLKANESGDVTVSLPIDDRDKMAAVHEFTTETYLSGQGPNKLPITTVKFKLADKRSSLELLMRHKKQLTDKVEFSGDVELIARLTAARKRLQPESKE